MISLFCGVFVVAVVVVLKLPIRELKHARFCDADGNRKRKFREPGQWCVPDFYANHL